ncbi:MAG: DUF4400 domain-containing protein [Burkholderiales bacterium]|nr:DUF4400 domain-containing protein [Burkholderiales bacterium]
MRGSRGRDDWNAATRRAPRDTVAHTATACGDLRCCGGRRTDSACDPPCVRGRESASLYHRAKHSQAVVVAMGGAVSLLLPTSSDPRWIWMPGVVVLAVLARLQWSFYKKHL